MNNSGKTVVILGGGAAGMMAAVSLIETSQNHRVVLIERNDQLGRKVMISGGGRCNVTTGIQDIKTVLSKYPRGERFLRNAMHHFPPQKMMQWMEDHGVPLKVEKDLRVFPKSDKGQDVVKAFEDFLAKNHIQILYKKKAQSVEYDQKDQKFKITLSEGITINSDKLILTTGGQAYRHTGSAGDGYAFAESLGHTITPLAPSLSAFLIEQAWVRSLSGVSLNTVRLKLLGEKKHEFNGPIIFTHKGLSGPAVFALSSLGAYETITAEQPKTLLLDFFPEETYESLTLALQLTMKENPGKNVQNTLAQRLPKSLAQALFKNTGISENKKNRELGKSDLNKCIETLKNTSVTVIDRSPGDEFVTAGGVELNEINPNTMESKRCPGLYFAGEILDCDGFTGGFNLQIAWATGRLAGESSGLVREQRRLMISRTNVPWERD